MEIPAGTGPVYFTGARLAAARARYAANPGNYTLVPGSDDVGRTLHQAFLYQMTGVVTGANGGTLDTTAEAVAWVVNTDFYNARAGNESRWLGEAQILSYSWLRPLMTAPQRELVIGKINTAIAESLQKYYQKSVGGEWASPTNNFNWGFTRNALLWGIVSIHEPYTHAYSHPAAGCYKTICNQPQAEVARQFLTESISVRWAHIIEMLSGSLRGGLFPEGSHYGPYLGEYFAMASVITKDFGLDIWRQTNFFREASMYLIYATTPKATVTSSTPYKQMFIYGDEQDHGGYAPANLEQYGNFMTQAVVHSNGQAIEGYIRQWLNSVPNLRVASYHKINDAELGSAGTSFAGLPLDFYVPGTGYLIVRDTWANGANDKPTVRLIHGGYYQGHSHAHCDAGSFQILRNDAFVGRNTPGRSMTYADHTGSGTVVAESIWTTNGITVNNNNYPDRDFCTQAPTVLRVQRSNQWAYLATDLKDYARIPGVTTLIREFVYVRGRNSLITLDRVETSSDVPKTALVHFQNSPSNPSAGTYVGVVARERMKVISLTDGLGSTEVDYVVINEGSAGGGSGGRAPQFRLQINARGSLQTYHVNVMHAHSTGDAEVNASVAESGSTITVTLTKAGAENVVVVFQKGMMSTGGTIQIGAAAANGFRSTIQGITVDANGVIWEGAAAAAP